MIFSNYDEVNKSVVVQVGRHLNYGVWAVTLNTHLSFSAMQTFMVALFFQFQSAEVAKSATQLTGVMYLTERVSIDFPKDFRKQVVVTNVASPFLEVC